MRDQPFSVKPKHWFQYLNPFWWKQKKMTEAVLKYWWEHGGRTQVEKQIEDEMLYG